MPRGGREVRYPEQINRALFYEGRTPAGIDAMAVHDSIREQLLAHSRKIANEKKRQRQIYRFQGRMLECVMMRTVNLPDGDWSSPEN